MARAKTRHSVKCHIKSKACTGDVVFYDSEAGKLVVANCGSQGDFSVLDKFSEGRYSPVGVVAVPASHDVYNSWQCGIVSLREMSSLNPTFGTLAQDGILYGIDGETVPCLCPDGRLPYMNAEGNDLADTVQGYDSHVFFPCDDIEFTARNPVDRESRYFHGNGERLPHAPSPYLDDGKRNVNYSMGKWGEPSSKNVLSDFGGKENTMYINMLSKGSVNGAYLASQYKAEGIRQGEWYIPSIGELGYLMARKNAINRSIASLKRRYGMEIGTYIASDGTYYMSSTPCGQNYFYKVHAGCGLALGGSRGKDLCRARAFIRTRFDGIQEREACGTEIERRPYSFTWQEMDEAYQDCVSTKKNTYSAIEFSMGRSEGVVRLCDDVNDRTYKIGMSIAFIVKYPVLREVFAAAFRDRIIHHLVINELLPCFEAEFIGDSYSCRIGMGVQYGVKRVYGMIRDCTEGYTKDAWVLKMDVKSFFMSINKRLLADIVDDLIVRRYPDNYKKDCLRYLCELIIMHHPEKNCKKKGDVSLWERLPKGKSLFEVGDVRGLPIGNLTSQIFANYYLCRMDRFITENLQFKYYGRYVDDFVIVCDDKEKILNAVPYIEDFAYNELGITIHPEKRYFQHYTKGVKFIGSMIKEDRIYIINRTKGLIYEKLRKEFKHYSPEREEEFICCINSYLGFMRPYNTYNIRKKILTDKKLLGEWLPYIKISPGYTKINLRTPLERAFYKSGKDLDEYVDGNITEEMARVFDMESGVDYEEITDLEYDAICKEALEHTVFGFEAKMLNEIDSDERAKTDERTRKRIRRKEAKANKRRRSVQPEIHADYASQQPKGDLPEDGFPDPIGPIKEPQGIL